MMVDGLDDGLEKNDSKHRLPIIRLIIIIT